MEQVVSVAHHEVLPSEELALGGRPLLQALLQLLAPVGDDLLAAILDLAEDARDLVLAEVHQSEVGGRPIGHAEAQAGVSELTKRRGEGSAVPELSSRST